MLHVTPRMSGCIGARPRASTTTVSRTGSPLPERVLLRLGADRDFTEAVLGDMAEEYTLRSLRDGASAARWWYGQEVIRSAPHFLRSWLRHARQYERVRLAALLGALGLTVLAILIALSARDGPPARLAGTSDAVIVNDREPVQLPVQVLDAAGHVLHAAGVRYQQLSGDPVRMSAAGEVTCVRRSDALVRASFGGLHENLLLRCRPISRFANERGSGLWLTIGDSAQELPIQAIGLDSTPETMLAGSAIVQDSNVASLRGLRVYPKAPGSTFVDVWVGGIVDIIHVAVFKRVDDSGALRPFEFFAAPLLLTSGQSRRWHIQPGRYFVSFRSDTVTSAALMLSTVGVTCSPFGNIDEYFCTASEGAAMVVSAPGDSSQARAFSGYLAVRRQ